MTKYQTASIQLSGLNCTACALNLDFDVEDIKGVKSCKTDYSTQKMVVEFDPQVISLTNLTES